MLADGRLAGGGENGTIKLWPTEGRNSATAQERGCAAGEPLVLSPGSSNNDFEAVQSLAVLADGWLASGGEDGLVKLWSTKFTGEPVVLSGLGSPGHELKGHGLGSGVSSLAVLPDGRLVSAGFDGEIKLWLVDKQKLIAALCLRAGRNLTQGEWDRYIGPNIPWQESCRPFGVPSNWRTIDENKSGALALDTVPAKAQPVAPPASSGPASPPASEKDSPAPVAPKDPWPRRAHYPQHLTHAAPHGNMTTPTGNTTDQLNQQELARQKSVVSTPDNSISGFFRSLFSLINDSRILVQR